MNRRLTHSFFLSVLLIVSLLAPKLLAAGYASANWPNQTIVICTGDGLRLITLDQDGTPISEGEQLSDLCIQVSHDPCQIGSALALKRLSIPVKATATLPDQIDLAAPNNLKTAPVRAPPFV